MATRGLPTWPHLNDSPDALPEAERLILDAARAWAIRGSLVDAALVLASASAEGTALLLDPLLRALPGLHLACPLCPIVTQGEASLLLAVSAVQHNGRGVALGLLHRLAPPLGAYRAMPALIGLATALKRGGVILSARL
ncbi:hypothetical protein [Sediminicoccus sp. KRV36]|uniref:hypothetical protein n=1 Tax=Sediminicoccus sp. KRV36 TaxID=3133721 RepID=UPI00200E1CBE|nr:hypothetical protein [Sediminicoccus rosea]UPY35391.1 hypothetical protein LHU95_14310 [Sediminicoccus rosea]